MKVANVQLSVGDDPVANLATTQSLIAEAAAGDARFVLTPEVTNCISMSRTHQQAVLFEQSADPTLAALRAQAADLGIWLLIGSLALKTGDADGRLANRSFLISPSGDIAAQYDKIHMFDVTVSESEAYHESRGYRPGQQAVVAQLDDCSVGMTICYDLRFPNLFRQLAQNGAQIITVPSAFSSVTGEAHWEVLLRARAIETGAYIIAPAQTGDHGGRSTYGHSLIVDPWGNVISDAGQNVGVTFAELDLVSVFETRKRIPAWRTDQEYKGPK